ncbi:efflux RND transporter periplasmic adaptor subunit [bacterium]|jgi:membrane fusion protein, heavy metal efflux system|nr:efflux RND transporter periplasmic adaptor subunit [bacterium]
MEPSISSNVSSKTDAPQRVWADRLSYVGVFALLAGVFAMGSKFDWKMPKFATLIRGEVSHEEDWCPEHAVPESTCVDCNDGLYDKLPSFGFCAEHGVAECVIHHPELAQVVGPPKLPAYDTLAALAVMDRPKNDGDDPLTLHRIQFATEESVSKAGIEVAEVTERPMSDVVIANGELTFDPTRVAHLTTRIQGTVVLVLKTLGSVVEADEMLALVDAGTVGASKSNLLQSIVQVRLRQATVDRLRSITDSGAVAQKSLLEAQASLQEAEISLISSRQALTNLGFEIAENVAEKDPVLLAEDLRFLGIDPHGLEQLTPIRRTSNLLPIRAPYPGTIVASDVVVGEVVDPKSILFTVADPTRMWLMLNVKQEDARYVRTGQTVGFETENGDAAVEGKVEWISPVVDEQTRTLRVRVVIDNSQKILRDRTFGTGRIVLREEPRAITVPLESLHETDHGHYVFVRDKNYGDPKSPRLFYPRQVRVGARDGGWIELLAGVLPGEMVATQGSSVILAQLLRNQLGAGHDHSH